MRNKFKKIDMKGNDYSLFIVFISTVIFINIKMKNKAKTPTPSTTIIIDSNNSSALGSKNISFIDNKKEYK